MKAYNGYSPYQRQQHHDFTKAMMAAGLIEPPMTCLACGQTEGRIEYHTEDYNWKFSSPGFPLCYRCHTVVHLRDKHADFWAAYRLAIREGLRFAPAKSLMDIYRHIDGVAIDCVPSEEVEVPTRHILDEIEAGVWKPEVKLVPPRDWRKIVAADIAEMVKGNQCLTRTSD